MVLRSDEFPLPPAALDAIWKRAHFADAMNALTRHHQRQCLPYRNLLATLGFQPGDGVDPSILPFLGAGIFRDTAMVSVPIGDVRRTLTSSGTTGRPLAQIHLDLTTSARQMLALNLVVTAFTGHERLPLLVLDAPAVLTSPAGRYAGRAAGVQGFSALGRGRSFALTNDLQPDIDAIKRFLEAVAGRPFLLYGFTFVIWTHFYETLAALGRQLDFSQGILVHGGGWKRLIDRQVSDAEFRRRSLELLGLARVHNYYGMVEQAGSIYMQCEAGFFHSSNFSEVFVRRASDFRLCGPGEPGIIQTMSLLPTSYPGHNLLTEDEGVLVCEDDCSCGRPGRHFLVRGRLQEAELKGCGDVLAAGHA
jgi:hypothetical protein